MAQINLADIPYDDNFKHIWHDVIKEQHTIKNIVARNIQALNGEEILHWMRSKVCFLFSPTISGEIEKLTCLKSGTSIHPIVMFKNFNPKKNIREEEIDIKLSIYNDPCVDLHESPRLDDLVLLYSSNDENVMKFNRYHCEIINALWPSSILHGLNARSYFSLDRKGGWMYFSKIYYSPKYDTICIEYVHEGKACHWQFLVPDTDPKNKGRWSRIYPKWKSTWTFLEAAQAWE